MLSDPERQQYDASSANGRMGGGPGFGTDGPQFTDFDLSDLFGGIFGGGGGRGPMPGAALTSRRTRRSPSRTRSAAPRCACRSRLETACGTCGGTGAEPGTAPTACPQCGGRGGVVSDSQGLFSLSHPCPRCRGSGTVVEHPCRTCRGAGRERTTKTFNVKIRPGIKDRAKIRVAEQGEAGRNGGPAGDLLVVVHVEPSPLYIAAATISSSSVPIGPRGRGARRLARRPHAEEAISLKVPMARSPASCSRSREPRRSKPKGGRGDLLARVGNGAGEGLQARARAARAAAEGEPLVDAHPRYSISVAAELVGMHQQTLRMYEAKGLVRQQTPGGTRRYSRPTSSACA